MNIAVLMHPETMECGFSYVGPFSTFEEAEKWCYIQNTDYPESNGMVYVVQWVWKP